MVTNLQGTVFARGVRKDNRLSNHPGQERTLFMPTKPNSSPFPLSPASHLGRSLRYYQKSHLNPDSWFRVVEGDYHQLIDAVDWNAVFAPRSTPYSLLDIGCGTGRFPTLLRSHLSDAVTIHYDMCDPSHYSLTTCRQSLQKPWAPRHAWQTTLEYAEQTWQPQSYDVAWAIQSLYCLTHDRISESLHRLLTALHPSHGTICILLAKRGTFFSQILQLFTEQFPVVSPPSYVSAETVATMLERLGAITLIRELECLHTISIWEDRLLEQYLQQCVMDTTPLPKWKAAAKLRTFLDSFRHGDQYVFPNSCWVILGVPGSAGQDGKHRLHRFLKAVTPTRLAS
jgi:SAM-dependent methyltransferase